ncbi:MAG TPA: hypothetical protein VI756_22515, partial [Blastocatellia bacterium]
IDSSRFRLYPMTSRDLFVVDMLLGLIDPVALLATIPTVGILLGCALRSPGSIPLGLVGLILFLVTNIALSRYVYHLIGALFANRRLKELIAVLIFLLLFMPQFFFSYRERQARSGTHGQHQEQDLSKLEERARAIYRYIEWLPPGLAARSLTGNRAASVPADSPGSGALALAVALAFASGCIALSYRATDNEYYGRKPVWSKLSRKKQPVAASKAEPVARAAGAGVARSAGGIERVVPWLSAESAAVFEKDMRYIARSPRATLVFLAPILSSAIFLLRAGPGSTTGYLGQYRLAAPILFVMLMGSQLTLNCFCLDWDGARLYFISPVGGRKVLIGKDTALLVLVSVQVAAIVVGLCLFGGPPTVSELVNAALVFVISVPIVLAVGNLVSVMHPRGMDFSKMYGRSSSGGAQLLAFVLFPAIFVFIAIGPLLAYITGADFATYIVWVVEAIVSLLAYVQLLSRAGDWLDHHPERFMTSLLGPR